MARAVPLKIVAGKISQYGATDQVAAVGVYPPIGGTVLGLGDPSAGVNGTTQINIGGIETSDVNIGVGYVGALQNINIGTDATGGTITLGNAGTLVQIDGALTVVSTSTFEGNTIIGNALADTLDVQASVINNLTFQKGFDHSILVDAASAGAGNALSVVGGAGFGANAGGGANLTGGAAPGAGAGGQVTLTGGTSATGVAGGITATTTRTASGAATDGAVLTLTQAAGTAQVFVGAIDPNTLVTGALGDLYLDTTAGDLYISAGGTSWLAVATGTGSGTLQSDYTNGGAGGGAIVLTATGGPLALSSTVAATAGLTATMSGASTAAGVSVSNTSTAAGSHGVDITKNGAGGGHGLKVLTNGAVTGSAIEVQHGGSSAAGFHLNNIGSGPALLVQDNGNDVLSIDATGAFTVTASAGVAIGSVVSLTAGVGGTGAGGAASLTAGAGGSAGDGGAASLTAGIASVATYFGGNVDILAGDQTSTLTGKGGSVSIQAGGKTNAAGTAAAGDVDIRAGIDAGSGGGGIVTIVGGDSDTGGGGPVNVFSGNAVASGVGGAVGVTAGAGLAAAGGAISLQAGASDSALGGAIDITAGASDSLTGGGLTLRAGGSGVTGAGGVTAIEGGDVTAGAGNGGFATIRGGHAFGTTGLGGSVQLNGGNSPGSVIGGKIELQGGTSGTGPGGTIILTGGLSGTGLPGATTLATSRTVNGTPATDGPTLTLSETGTGGGSASLWAGTTAPHTTVTGTKGSLYLKSNDGTLWINQDNATTWFKVETGTGGSATLQTAYDNGIGGPASTTISETLADGGIKIDRGSSTDTYVLSLTDTTSAQNVLSVSKTAAAAGSGIDVTMGASTTGAAISIVHAGTGAATHGVEISKTGVTGSATHITMGAATTAPGHRVTMAAGSTGEGILIEPAGTSATSYGLNIASTAVTDVSSRLIRVVSNALLAAGQGIAVSMLSTSSGTGIAVTTASGATSKGITIVQGAASLGGIEITQSGVVLQPSIEVVLSATGTTAAYGIEVSGGGALSAAARFATTGSSAIKPAVEIQANGTGNQTALDINSSGGAHGTLTVTNAGTGEAVIIDATGGGPVLSVRRNIVEMLGVDSSGGVTILCQAATPAASPGAPLNLTAGAATNPAGAVGGAVGITAGAALGASAGGIITITGGTSPTGVPGAVRAVTTATASGTSATDRPVMRLAQAAGTAALFVGTSDPSSVGPLDAGATPSEGSLYLKTTATAGQLWVKTGAAATAWTQVGTTATSASQIVQTGFDTTTNTVTNGLLGYLTTTANLVQKTIATSLAASRVFGANEGTAGSMTTAGTIESQLIEAAITIAAGDELFLSDVTAGAVTNVAPTASGSVILTVGYARTNGTGAGGTVQMVLQIGTSVLIP